MRRIFAIVSLLLSADAFAQNGRWYEKTANDWYAKQPWLVGSDYIPANAINEMEMWQAGTFDPQSIDLELGWAEGLGMNTMRVFLHDLLWQQDAAGFRKRIDSFLRICDKHRIKPMLVLFDSVWDPFPKQHAPTPGVHNSGLLQSPGADALREARAAVAAVSSADSLHRVHGARTQEHFRRSVADREEVQGCGDQLGTRRRQDADLAAVGFLAETLRRPGA